MISGELDHHAPRRRLYTQLDALHGSPRAARPRPDEQFVVYRILDTLTDSFFPVLARSTTRST